MNFRFGQFQLLPAQRLLLEDGKPIRLGARAMDILLALVDRAGEVVSKDDLIDQVWSRQFVEDTNIRVHVGVVRKALADGTHGRRYISTIAGKGYSFVGEITREEIVAHEDTEVGGPSSLPPVIRLIGREDAVGEILHELSTARLLTVAGPGGIGKTTVALAAAEAVLSSFQGQVFYVDLSPVTDPSYVPSAVAAAIGLPVLSKDPLPTLLRSIRSRRLLLILDSCEHLIEAVAPLVEAIVAAAPELSILATSREPLRLRRERVYRLPPLPIPMEVVGITAAEAMGYPSVQLFMERVSTEIDDYELTDDEAPIVANICRRLDGIALAIELAAGRVEALGVRGVADQLDDRLQLLSRGQRSAVPRHRTLTAAINWSYDGLPDLEKAALQKLSIFPGTFTLQSAFVIAGEGADTSGAFADVLAALVSKSLLQVNTERTRTEYRLLDMTRAYARQKLVESGEYEAACSRHARHLKGLFETAAASNDSEVGKRWPADYSGQIDDLRAALTWSLRRKGDFAAGVAITIVSVPLWIHLSLVQECRWHVAKALELSGPDMPSNDRMALYAALAMSEMYIGSDMRELDRAWTQALHLSEQNGDEKYRARAIWGLSSCHILSGKLESAFSLGSQYRALAEASGDTGATYIGDRLMGQAALYLGKFTQARSHLEAVLYKYTRPAEKLHVLDQKVMAQSFLSRTLWIMGFPDQGRRLMQDTVEYARTNGHAISVCMALSQSACHLSRWLDERQLFSDSVTELLDCSQRYGLAFMRAPGLCYNGLLMIEQGQTADGLVHFQEGFEEFRRNSIGLFRDILCDLAVVLCSQTEYWKATLAIDEAAKQFLENGEFWFYPECLRIKGEIKLAEGLRDEAVQYFQDALSSASRFGALSWELRAATSMTKVDLHGPEREMAFEHLIDVYDRFTEGLDTADLKTASLIIEEWRTTSPRGVVGMFGNGSHR